MTEIAEQIGEPAYRKRDFATRDYYGTMNHNSKAVFQYYFGWWDGVPANYHRWPPAEESARYFEAMGGAEAALATGIRAYDRGDYRWSSVVFNHVVFAQPENTVAKNWLASSYEQQGFQAEAGTWRNYFLKAAQELREGPPTTGFGPSTALATLISGVPTETLFETLLARYDPENWLETGTTIQFVFTDTKEDIALHVREGSIFPRFGERAAEPVVTLTTQRKVFNQVLTDPSARVRLLLSADWSVTGNPLALIWFLGSIGAQPKPFNIVTP